MEQPSEKDHLLHLDVLEQLRRTSTSPWIRLIDTSGSWDWGWFSAMVPLQEVEGRLQDPTWDLTIGDGIPTVISSYMEGADPEHRYYAKGEGPVEALAIRQTFSGLREPALDISEEFRLAFNLWRDTPRGTMALFNDSGEPEVVARISKHTIEVRADVLREFLAAKDMCLLVFVDSTRDSKRTLNDLGLIEDSRFTVEADICFRLVVAGDTLGSDSQCFSRFTGKAVIRPCEKGQSRLWPTFEEPADYPEFIIGFNDNGRPKSFTCDPERLANFFGANPDAPQYVTPVFFRREVLRKYLGDDRYSVSDGYLRCAYLWGMRIDNNHPRFVVALLGDLGRDLPATERLYWRSFNVAPQGGLSSTAFRRAFLGEWAEPIAPELRLREALGRLYRRWQKTIGWSIVSPLSVEDQHNLDSMTVPVSESQADFDDQVLRLNKVLIESINEGAMKKLGISADAGSINHLEAYLRSRGITGMEDSLRYLRKLRDLRSGVGHRKGPSYFKAMKHFQVEELGRSAAVGRMILTAVRLIAELEAAAAKESNFKAKLATSTGADTARTNEAAVGEGKRRSVQGPKQTDGPPPSTSSKR